MRHEANGSSASNRSTEENSAARLVDQQCDLGLWRQTMKIVVLDGFTLNPGDHSWEGIEELGDLTVYDRTAPAEVVPRASDAKIVLTNKTVIDAKSMAQLDSLEMISVLATGYNVVDIDAARRQGITVCNVPVYGTHSVAQHIFAVLLSWIHRPFAHDQAIRDGHWSNCDDFSFWLQPTAELSGKTLGIVGYGRIGRQVGQLGQAFGMNIIASTRTPREAEGVRFCSNEELFSESDVISLNCPLTESNREFVDCQLLAMVKPNMILINASRGGLICEAALADALNREQLAAALLDVVSVEPIEDSNPLLSAKNCMLTPHYAWATIEARRRLMQQAVKNIAAFQAGKPINVV